MKSANESSAAAACGDLEQTICQPADRWALQPPSEESGHGTHAGLEARILEASRKLGGHLEVGHMMVARVWRKFGLKAHRIELYMASNDPHFERMAADIIGLY